MSAFDALRHDDQPVAPDRAFTEQLRARLTAELAPTVQLPERNPTMTTQETTTPSTAAAEPSPAGGLVPYISVHDAAAAIDWYRAVLGAVEEVRYVGDDGRIGHCQLVIGGSMLMLADEYPDYGSVSPRTIGGTPVKLHLNVDDVDAVWELALANGAEGQRPPEDQPYGERSCSFGDPFGHQWMVQTTIADLTTAEIDAAMDGFTVSDPDPDA